jgi:probable F420-dependent oxidoreductase
MRIGLSMPLPAYTIDPAFMGRTAERLGFESIWYAEHPAVPVKSDSPFPATGGAIPLTYSHFTEPYIALARASAVTTTLKLATGITLVPQRNPLLLAKEVAALDHHSGGRFILGVGTGWLKEEVEIFGGNFARRWTQTREALDVMKALWTQDAAEFHGEFFDFPPVRSYPKPKQKPHPPIFLGGETDHTLKRVVEFCDGWFPRTRGGFDPKVAVERLKKAAIAGGRDPKTLSITVFAAPPDAGKLAAYREAGIDRVLLEVPDLSRDEILRSLDKNAALVKS